LKYKQLRILGSEEDKEKKKDDLKNYNRLMEREKKRFLKLIFFLK
jgi:hypothetical protein